VALDVPHPLLEFAVENAVAAHRGVVMRQGFAQPGDVGRQIRKPKIVAVYHGAELVELSGMLVYDEK